jgi:hypothetical protein
MVFASTPEFELSSHSKTRNDEDFGLKKSRTIGSCALRQANALSATSAQAAQRIAQPAQSDNRLADWNAWVAVIREGDRWAIAAGS